MRSHSEDNAAYWWANVTCRLDIDCVIGWFFIHRSIMRFWTRNLPPRAVGLPCLLSFRTSCGEYYLQLSRTPYGTAGVMLNQRILTKYYYVSPGILIWIVKFDDVFCTHDDCHGRRIDGAAQCALDCSLDFHSFEALLSGYNGIIFRPDRALGSG
ncbi:hypothetical protein PYCCODRAFT_163179 [Trametes coccinea BRFM310]|uniref:Uncharacterized protein n=1 Tax=Trametes coccinea (strain BRFM310) TaxID=1353009 RepID=A0A1Y2IS57_TRAC3|nr:hypothetical protein PYCCODRAFT_163179 [Trametes coccinea BRFM310]